jgi:hypothetical protein
MLARLTDAMHQLVLRLLKLGGESRHLTLEWIASCLHANKGLHFCVVLNTENRQKMMANIIVWFWNGRLYVEALSMLCRGCTLKRCQCCVEVVR